MSKSSKLWSPYYSIGGQRLHHYSLRKETDAVFSFSRPKIHLTWRSGLPQRYLGTSIEHPCMNKLYLSKLVGHWAMVLVSTYTFAMLRMKSKYLPGTLSEFQRFPERVSITKSSSFTTTTSYENWTKDNSLHRTLGVPLFANLARTSIPVFSSIK